MRRRHNHHRRSGAGLKVALGERSPVLQHTSPVQRPPTLLPHIQKSAKDVLTILLASAGLALAARKDALVELLPGGPTTLLISSGGKVRAAFVLPVSEAEASKLIGRPAGQQRDGALEALWHEERAADLMQPDVELEHHQEITWGGGYAC